MRFLLTVAMACAVLFASKAASLAAGPDQTKPDQVKHAKPDQAKAAKPDQTKHAKPDQVKHAKPDQVKVSHAKPDQVKASHLSQVKQSLRAKLARLHG